MKRIWQIFTKQQESVGGAAMILMIMVFFSRILGLFRDRLLASHFGPDELGVYFAAFRLPNLIFELLVMGALTSAFIPVFTRLIAQGKDDDGWKMASTVINLSFIFLFLISLPIMIWSKQFSQFLAPGFSDTEIDQMASFTRFMIFFQVFPLLIGNFFTGIAQSYKFFLIPALAPVVYNIGIIIGILFLSPFLGLGSAVIGVGIGAAFFMLIHLPLIWSLGYRHYLLFDPKEKGVHEVAKLMAPRTLGLAVAQIDTTVDLMLATLLGARMVTIFNFAQHLQQLPIGLFGITIATAALPSLSIACAREDKEYFKKTMVSSLLQILFFVLPVSVFFIVLRIPIVRLVFGASRFDWQATVLTGMTLSTFSISLFAQSVVQVLARGFYALYDSKTPVVVGIIAILLNTFLSIGFISFFHLPIWSLGLSTSAASIVNAIALLFFLSKRIGGFSWTELFSPSFKMTIAALVTGIALYIPLKLFDQLIFDTTRTFGLILLTAVTSMIGLSSYFFLSWVMGVNEVKSFMRLIGRLSRAKKIILEPATEVVNGGIQNKIS